MLIPITSIMTPLIFSLITIAQLTASIQTLNATQKSKPGLAYSPYNGNGDCKSRDQVLRDMDYMRDFRLVRSYGVSCGQVRNIIEGAKLHGAKVFLGINGVNNSDNEIRDLISSVNGDWDMVDTVAVGNEYVHRGLISAEDLAGRVNSSRDLLRGAGYIGPIIAVDTFDGVIKNPVICQASDYAGVNIHPWFDINTPASDAGQFIRNQQARVAAACPGKSIIVTETGWPYSGDSHGKAVASRADQEDALRSEYGVVGVQGIFLGPFDDLWKKDHSGSYNSEKYWGIEKLELF